MNIIEQIGRQVFSFKMRHADAPDRLIINYDRLNELRAEPTVQRYFVGPLFDTFMDMKIITTHVDIDGGFEVR